jgi:hypothetical protein
MDVINIRFFENKKFMWDDVVYETRADAEGAKDKYETSNFEVRLVEQEDKFLLYTRRVVTDVKVEGTPA